MEIKIIEEFLLLFVILNIFYLNSQSQEVSGRCGFPGKPYMSKLEPDNKLYYEEGDEVEYECIEYWFYTQRRKCKNGRWTGNSPRCG